MKKRNASEVQERKLLIWRHNALIGSSVLIRKCCSQVQLASTTTEAAKVLADKIEVLSRQLERELRANRIDPK